MDAVISIVGSLAGKAAEYTVDPLARHFSYLFKPKSKFQNLRSQLQQLKDARERVQHAVNEANRRGDDIFSNVVRWLTEVDGKIRQVPVSQIEENEEKAKQMCFVGLCPNFKSRYQLSRKAEEEANAIAQLLKDKDRFDGVISYRPAPEGIATRPVKEYEHFESRTGAFDAVMEALKDANSSIIGVYGMGGVGKTTLVRQVAAQAEEEKMFDEVVMAAVTQSFDIMRIQDQIADQLGLKSDKKTDAGRRDELRQRLKKTKKILVILDDIWVELNMEAVGIPYGPDHQGCKILLTSRELYVLSSMDSQKNLQIETLKEEEAWELFQNMATDIVLSHDLQDTAKEVARKCAGLPIAIVTVGKAMKSKKKLSEWKDALRELNRPSERNFKGIPKHAYSAIELSYKFLEEKGSEYQSTFLLCSIMGHDAAVEDLLKNGIGLGLFHGVYTIQETRDRVSTLVSNLKASSLLLDGSTSEFFDMHDVVCDVAVSIASRDRYWLALIGRDEAFKGWSDEEKQRNCSLISLQNAKFCEFLADHEQLECPNLTFFSLRGEDSSLKFSNNFFEGLQKLRVLDFAKIDVLTLPLSIGFLKNIHTLNFSKCHLKDIAIIGELKNLEILCLRISEVVVIPREIGELTKLKLLDLSQCYSLEVISPNVLSSLSRLEELYLYDSFERWEVEGDDEKPIRGNARLAELHHLSQLTTLEVHIPNEQAMSKEFMFSEKLERFKISIGEIWYDFDFEPTLTSRKLKLMLNNKSIHSKDAGVKMLLRKIEALCLDGVEDVMEMLYDPNIEGFSYLKYLYLRNDLKVKYMINSMRMRSVAFPLLESLILVNLMNLEAICYGELKPGYFGGLRRIVVGNCKMLKNLFSLADVARELRQVVEEIAVANCENCITLIVEKRSEEEIAVEFSQLRSLILQTLPNLKGMFYSEKIDSSATATSLFDSKSKVVFPVMKELSLSELPLIEKVWDDHQLEVMSLGVQNLKSLTVGVCHNLKNLFTTSMVKSFVQLKTLVVESCDKMEEIIIVSEGLVEEQGMAFPKLDCLKLKNLPNLKRVYFGNNSIDFPFLKELEIVECPVLNTFHCDSTTVVGNEAVERRLPDVPKYLFTNKLVFPVMKELFLSELPLIEKVWDDRQIDVMSLGVQNLKSLTVGICHNLKNLFTTSMVKSFVQLKTLVVESCDKMEEIIIVSEGLVEEQGMVFPKLDCLKLKNLPNLKRVYFENNPIEFSFLKELEIEECPVLNTFHCDSTTVVGNEVAERLLPNVPKYLFTNKVLLPMLQNLTIKGLKNLERLWVNQIADDSFSKLTNFQLEGCDKVVKGVFPLSMLTTLQRLNEFSIKGCSSLEEIFESQEEEQDAHMVQEDIVFEFPHLTSLQLWNLPKLKSFFPKIHTTKWPSLKDIDVRGCDKFEIIFASESETSGILMGQQLEIPIQQPLFWINQLTLQNLQKLFLGCNDGMKQIILHPQKLPISDYFPKLKLLTLFNYPPQSVIFPSYLFQLLSLPNLQKLEIELCCFKELVFQSEAVGGDNNPASASSYAWMVLSQLIELHLLGLPELTHLWKEKEAFQNLRILYVSECPNLKGKLVPSSVCFKNLMTLRVRRCHGITKLVTHSTAKSLVQLKEMVIRDCHKIQEIIQGSDGENEVKDEISFPQLNILILGELSKLESFCSSGNHTFEFPSLAKLVVEDCQNMKMFSQGNLNAPMLYNVGLSVWVPNKLIWEGSLNSTIKQLYKENHSTEDEGNLFEEGIQDAVEDEGNPSTSNMQLPFKNSKEDQLDPPSTAKKQSKDENNSGVRRQGQTL